MKILSMITIDETSQNFDMISIYFSSILKKLYLVRILRNSHR